jgi:chitodextrinase
MLAPGSQILAGGISESGTSQAAPHVAGAVAVLRSAFPAESLDQTLARLTNGTMVTDSRNDIAKPRLSLPLAVGVTAAPCTYALAESSHAFDSQGATGSVAVTAGAGCTWIAASNVNDASWISVTSGGSGSGNGVVNYVIAPNPNVVGRTGSISVAGKAYMVAQSGSVGAVANRLINPGFEDGAVAWTQSTANGYPVITALVNPPDVANSWYAWFCGYNNCNDTLYQDVFVPADAQSAYVQFSYWIKTSETAVISVYDSMLIRVSSTIGATPARIWSLSNLNASTGWVLSQPYDVSAFKGQTVRLQFSATTDASLATDFYVDDVNLMVSGSVPDTQTPTVPTGLSAVPISTSAISLTWAAASDNVGVSVYELFRDGALLTSKGGATSFTDTGLVAGVTHSYAVAACDAVGNCSIPSQSVIAVTPSAFLDTLAPTVPTGLYGMGTSVSTLSLSWGAAIDSVGVTQYKVYRNGTLLVALGNVTTYTDSGLTPSTTYSYTVSACDAVGNCSAQTSALSVSTLSPFSSSTPLIIEGAISVNWSANTANISIARITNRSSYLTSGSLRIELWAFATPYTGSELGYKTASIRTVSITGLTDQLGPNQSFTGLTMTLPYAAPPTGNTHFVIFLTEYSTSCSQADKFCYTYYANLYETQSPTVPSGLSAIATNSSQVDLAWTAATDNVGVATYKVFRNGVVVAVLGNVTSYRDIGLTPSTAFSYTIAACDSAGNCSAQSAASAVTTLSAPDTQAPSVPIGLSAVALSSSQVRLAWAASTDNVGVSTYQIFSSGSLVDTLGNVTNVTRVTVPLATYRYSVAACDAVGNCSTQSAVATVTTPAQADTQPPSVPAGLTATPTSASAINLAWVASTDNFGVTSYKVYRDGSLLTTLSNVTGYSDIGLRAITTYSYSVEACDASSNCSGQNAAVSATTAASITIAQAFFVGWNLAGNSTDAPINVPATFANTNDFLTVWKWNPAQGSWGFYAPTLAALGGTNLADYAASKGYQEMTQIIGGEGFWVNSRQATSTNLPIGNVIGLTGIGATLVKGWNLVSLGEAVTPKQFCDAQGSGITTLWAWDNLQGKWYFYAPNLAAVGGSALSDYIAAKGYLDFSTVGKLLGPGVGFWVNKP